MKIEGNVVHYLLSQEYGDIECDKSARSVEVDYPILYDETDDMHGHAALVPAHERPHRGIKLGNGLCICMGEESAASARNAGFAVIHVRDDVTFPRLYNYMQEVFVKFERLDARLRTYIDAEAGSQALLDACSEATGCPFALVDTEYRTLCQSKAVDEPSHSHQTELAEYGMLESNIVDLFMASRGYRHMRMSHNVFTIPGSPELLMKNLFVNGNLKGMLISAHDGSALGARYTRFILRYFSNYLEKLHAHLGSFGVAPSESDRIRTAIANMLSKGLAEQTGIDALIAEDGRLASGSYAILKIERSFTHEGREGLAYLARRFEQAWPRSYCFIVDESLFMLADAERASTPNNSAFGRDILVAARDNLAKAGMSRTFSSFDGIDAARVQAAAALEQGLSSDPSHWVYRFDDYALSWMLNHGVRGTPVDYILHPAATVLARHDNRNGTELLHTLSMLMRCRFNATRTSAELFVARSTLLNRIDRIVELTGLDFEDVDDLTYLALSLFLTRLQRPGTAQRN